MDIDWIATELDWIGLEIRRASVCEIRSRAETRISQMSTTAGRQFFWKCSKVRPLRRPCVTQNFAHVFYSCTFFSTRGIVGGIRSRTKTRISQMSTTAGRQFFLEVFKS